MLFLTKITSTNQMPLKIKFKLRFYLLMKKTEKGNVYLIGAGPGDPDLITIKGKQILNQCDVVIYDLLVPTELIFSLKDKTIKYYVGKKAGKHTLPQNEINKLLVKFAKQGKSVARLKGGDPFLFGRGAEEAKYLKKNGISYEIIPGITAGLGATAYSGISCTDRNKSSFVIFATGHKAKKKSVKVPWHLLAKAAGGTIVIYMVVNKLNEIVRELISHGMLEKIPSAIIERGTLPTQKIVCSPLKDLPKKASTEKIKPPSILVIGDVTGDQKLLSWIKKRPLLGARIIVTGDLDNSSHLCQDFRDKGAEAFAYPTYKFKTIKNKLAWKNLSKPIRKVIILNKPSDVISFLNFILEKIKDIRKIENFQIATIGYRTGITLNKFSISSDYHVINENLPQLFNKFQRSKSPNNLTIMTITSLLNSEQNMTIQRLSKSHKMEYLSLKIFQQSFNKWPDGLKEKLLDHPPNFVLFPNPISVQNFIKNISFIECQKLLKNGQALSYNDETSKFIKEKKLKTTKQLIKQSSKDILKEVTTRFKQL